MKIGVVIAILHNLYYSINPDKCKLFSIKNIRKVVKISLRIRETGKLDRQDLPVVNYR